VSDRLVVDPLLREPVRNYDVIDVDCLVGG
jgi:hypothetical protein